MESQSSDEEEVYEMKQMHKSINFGEKKNTLALEEDKKGYRKRSSSLSLKIPKNFVPKLKPIKTNICPSPINLDQKTPDSPEKMSLNQNEINLKPIKLNRFKKRKLRKSTKFLNIEEETHETEAISDYEDKSKKATLASVDLDSSKSDIEDNDNCKNINVIRKKMETIKNNNSYYDNINDDSNINKNYPLKRLYQNKNIYKGKIYEKTRQNKNMDLDPLKSNKNRTRSYNIRQGFVSTILGFLEKSNSSLSLKSNGK
jgi:hypothetical protein